VAAISLEGDRFWVMTGIGGHTPESPVTFDRNDPSLRMGRVPSEKPHLLLSAKILEKGGFIAALALALPRLSSADRVMVIAPRDDGVRSFLSAARR
jgi:hypothetical protein